MYEFVVSLRLEMMVCVVSRLNKVFGKGLKYGTRFGKFWVKVKTLVMER